MAGSSPTVLDEMLRDRDTEKVEQVTSAFLRMKKFDIGELEKAYEGNRGKSDFRGNNFAGWFC